MPDEQAGSSTATEQPLPDSAPGQKQSDGADTTQQPNADSEPAAPKPRQRTPADSERRYRQLANENRELKQRLDRLEKPPEKPKEPEPLRRPVYKDFTQFGDDAWDRYEAAVDAYTDAKANRAKAEAKREALEEFERTSTERAQARYFEELTSKWNKQCEAERRADPEFDDIAFDPELKVTDGMLRYMFKQETGAKILKWLGQNADEAERISRLDNEAMIEALAEIKLTVSGKTAPKQVSGRKLSNAPPPPAETGGRNGGDAGTNPMMAALARNDTAEYMRLYREAKLAGK